MNEAGIYKRRRKKERNACEDEAPETERRSGEPAGEDTVSSHKYMLHAISLQAKASKGIFILHSQRNGYITDYTTANSGSSSAMVLWMPSAVPWSPECLVRAFLGHSEYPEWHHGGQT